MIDHTHPPTTPWLDRSTSEWSPARCSLCSSPVSRDAPSPRRPTPTPADTAAGRTCLCTGTRRRASSTRPPSSSTTTTCTPDQVKRTVLYVVYYCAQLYTLRACCRASCHSDHSGCHLRVHLHGGRDHALHQRGLPPEALPSPRVHRLTVDRGR